MVLAASAAIFFYSWLSTENGISFLNYFLYFVKECRNPSKMKFHLIVLMILFSICSFAQNPEFQE